MGVPFVAQLGFAEVDSSGPIVPLTGTADASVQFYKLTQSVNGVITIPNNNKHKKIILDVNGKTISGGGVSPIIHNNDSTELSLKGNGFITSSGSLSFSGNGTGDATVDSATQGLGSTGSVVIDVQDNDIPFPARDDFEDLIEVRNGTYFGPINAYAYYPEYYYTANPPGTIPPGASSSAPVTIQYNNSTWQAYQNTLMQDISGSSNVMQSSSGQPGAQFGALFSIGAGRFELRVPHNGAVAILKHDGTNSTFESGTGTITGSQTRYSTRNNSGAEPYFGVQERCYTWVITVGGVALDITARWKADTYRPGNTPYYAGGLYFGTNIDATSPLPSGTTMRLPATGIFTEGKRAVVQNNNDNPINFSLAGGTDSSVPANDSATVVNSASTAESWSFSGEKPTATVINQSSAGINVIDSAFTVDISQQVDFFPYDVSNVGGSTGGQRSRYRLQLRSGSLPIRLPNGNTVTAGTVLSTTQMKSLLGSPSSPNNWGNSNNPFSWEFQSYPQTTFTTFTGSTFTMNTDNKTCISMGAYGAGNSGGTNPSDFYYRGHCYHEDGFIQGYLLTINTTGGDVEQAIPPTEVSRSYVYGPHGDFSVALLPRNYFPSVKVGSVDVINGRTRFTNKGTTIINDFTPTILGTSRGNQGVLGVNAQITLDSQDASSTFTGTVPQENTAGDPLAPAAPITGTGVSNNDSGRPVDGVDLSAFTGTINSIRSGESPSTIYIVTVAPKSSYDSGSSNAFYIDGVERPTLTLTEGNTYFFIQSDASNGAGGSHPLRFSTTANGTHGSGSEYTTGVTVVGTPGTFGAYTKITVAASAPTLYYYCSNHSNMGGQLNTA
tara:strand:+ start:21273 stop:23780 length:2508 start_codon:yes stop_codon:yes gene_type:complete